MITASDPFAPGSVVAARLAPSICASFDPVLRSLLSGTQVFIKQSDGLWRPRGCQFGLARCFAFDDLLGPVSRG